MVERAIGLEAGGGVLIRSQEKRWASCDPAGVLRINWRIVQASLRLVDYVAVYGKLVLIQVTCSTTTNSGQRIA